MIAVWILAVVLLALVTLVLARGEQFDGRGCGVNGPPTTPRPDPPAPHDPE